MALGETLANESDAGRRADGKKSGLSPTTVIANVIRRSGRQTEAGSEYRDLIVQMGTDSATAREVYLAGMQEGRQVVAQNLADVLYTVQYAGLGRAAVVEESNSHVLFRVHDCICRRLSDDVGCSFVAGFIAGALLSTGRYHEIEVREQACGEFPGRTCTYRAEVRMKS